MNSPTVNFDVCERIFLKIGSRIQRLTIATVHFRFPLDFFSNLKSLIICSPFEISLDQFTPIFNSLQFQKLNCFQLQSKICINNHYFRSIKIIFSHIFHAQNSLHTFEWLSTLCISDVQLMINTLTINKYIRSLSLKLCDFRALDFLFQYTPNLKELNLIGSSYLRSQDPLFSARQMPVIRLEKFSFTASIDGSVNWLYRPYISPLIDLLKQFSSSLIVLSIDLNQKCILENQDFNFNTLITDFLQGMTQLKTFRFYVRLGSS